MGFMERKVQERKMHFLWHPQCHEISANNSNKIMIVPNENVTIKVFSKSTVIKII
jgi:hypothetical protein